MGYACFVGRGNVPQRGLLGEVGDAQEFARGPLDSIPGAAQEKTRERQMWHEETIRAQCWGDKQQLLSEPVLAGRSLGQSEVERDWSMLRQVRKHLVLSVPCLRVGKWTRKSMHLHRQHFQGASESEEATRDMTSPSTCPCITLCLCPIVQTSRLRPCRFS